MENSDSAHQLNSSLDLGLDAFKRVYMPARNYAARTRKEYEADIASLITFLTEKCGVHTAARVQKGHLDAYLAYLDGRGFLGSTRRRRVAAIRTFFAFLEEQGFITVSPAKRLLPPEREYRQPRVLSEQEYKRLQLACAHETRDGALIELLLQTGLRLSEVARLPLGDVELPARISQEPGHTGSVQVLGKGRKARTVTLNWRVCKAIKSYLAVRPKVDDPHLFITKFGRGMSPRAIENAVAKYLRQARIAAASVHSLRHTFATHMVKKGTRLDVVRQALGHESLKTTSIYVELARDEMDKDLQANAL